MPIVKCALLACLCLLPAALLRAELGVGSTREEVMAELGAPKSKMGAGGKEIFSYPKGRIVFADGKVVSIEWKGPVPAAPAPAKAAPQSAPPPAPAKPAPAPAKAPTAALSREAWLTDFAAAQAEATATKRRLLVLFTGSDWCPPCIEFEASVAHADDFLNVTRPAFVLVKLDYPRTAPQAPAVRARNEELRQRYGVASYPSLLVISSDGTKSARVDTRKGRQADGIVDYYVQAVDEARNAKDKSSFWPW
jgi:thiol-disulfide isomerase/thioredoxin